MKNLNLNPEFSPFGESIKFESLIFNGGEPHIRILENLYHNELITITTRIRSFNDLGMLLLANDALKRMGVEKIKLLIPYFPGGRQDRVENKGEALTIKIYADLINNMNFEEVMIFDPHSDVTPALINNVKVLDNYAFVSECLQFCNQMFAFVSPDNGASKKTYKLSQNFKNIDVIEGTKKRDPLSGKINNFKVYSNDLNNKACVIVDDICDGGGTFIGIAKELKKLNAGDLTLIVSHGIFSKGIDELKKYFKNIFCTDSFRTIKDENIKQIKLNDILLKNEVHNKAYIRSN